MKYRYYSIQSYFVQSIYPTKHYSLYLAIILLNYNERSVR